MTDDTYWTIPTLRAFYDERLDENQRRSDERYQKLLDAMENESESIDKRFEAANRYKETYSATLSRIENETLKRVEFDTRLGAQQEKLDILGKVNWPVYLGFGAIFATMIVGMVGGLWVIIGMKIDATNQPTVLALEQVKVSNESRDRSVADLRADFQHQTQIDAEILTNKSKEISNLQQTVEASKVDRGQLNERMRNMEGQVAASAQSDANSRTDRGQLNERMTKIEDSASAANADRKANEAAFKSNLVEIETQFCGSDTVRNLMHANDLRVLHMLWQKSGLGEYPINNAYYPQVCNRNINPK